MVENMAIPLPLNLCVGKPVGSAILRGTSFLLDLFQIPRKGNWARLFCVCVCNCPPYVKVALKKKKRKDFQRPTVTEVTGGHELGQIQGNGDSTK